MTHRATDTVTGQRAIEKVGVAAVGEPYERALEIAAPRVEVELPLAHDTVAGETEVGYFTRKLGVSGRRQRAHVRQFAVELREENRITPGEAHRRPAPFAVRRDVSSSDRARRSRRRWQKHGWPERPVQ